MRSRIQRAALVLGCLVGWALLAAPSRAENPPVDEAAFLAALDKAKFHLGAGRAAEGQKIVQETLKKHEGQDYVRAKKADLEDLVRRLAFRAECTPPEAQSVVKGKLKKFSSKTGDIEIRYTAGQPTDFKSISDSQVLFPARFRGPYTVTIRGDAYTSKADTSPVVMVGGEENPKTGKAQKWQIIFGVPAQVEGTRKYWLPAKIIAFNGEDEKVVTEKETCPAQIGKPFRLDVTVSSTRVAASIDGTSIGSASKPDGLFGQVAMRVVGWTEITISGQIEPSWIQGQLDAIVDKQKRAFDAKFDVKQSLPSWLYEGKPVTKGSGPAAPVPAETGPLCPPKFAREHLSAMALLLTGDFDEALKAAEALRAKGAPDGVTGLLAAQALLGMDEATKALAEIDKALAASPDAVEVLLVKAEILMTLGREDDLVATLKAAIERPTASKLTFETAGMRLLLAGRHEDARAVTEAAARRGLQSPVLDTIGRLLVRTQNGPDWPKTYEYKSANYHIVSDIDAETCRTAGTLLEDALLTFKVHVHALKPAAQKKLYKVYLFSGEAGFKRYVGDAMSLSGKAPEHVAGLYSPILKQLLIWNLPSRDEMMKTIRHEGFHQYLDRLLPDPPVWFNEGMAVYFEANTRVGGELRNDKPRADLVEILEGKAPVPLKDFLEIRPKDFYATAPHSYAQGWLVVHFLRHGPLKYRELYRSFMTHLETEAGAEAVDAVFDEKVLASMDADLATYLASMHGKR